MKVNVYFDPSSGGFYQSDIHKIIPNSAIEITNEYRWNLLQGQSEGMEIVVESGEVFLREPIQAESDLIAVERNWRDAELKRADIELYKVQDSDSNAIGSVAAWRDYRKSLRSWPEHSKFPTKEQRPMAPDV